MIKESDFDQCHMLCFCCLMLWLIFYSWQWWPWSQIISKDLSDTGSYIVSYFFYIVWALLFAVLAATLVRMFAPYACGSGVPEVIISYFATFSFVPVALF